MPLGHWTNTAVKHATFRDSWKVTLAHSGQAGPVLGIRSYSSSRPRPHSQGAHTQQAVPQGQVLRRVPEARTWSSPGGQEGFLEEEGP